jgi:hypothetical protein
MEVLQTRTVGGLLLLFGAMPAIFLISRPFEVPAAGLDPSWKYAAEYAYLNGLVFGRDFSFTCGPLSFVYTHLFHPETFHWIAISTVHALMIYFAAVWWSANRCVAVACLAVLALIFAPLAADALFFSLCLLVFLMAIAERTPTVVVVVLVTGLAIPSLAKFNIFLLAMPLMLLADATALARRSPCYGLSAIYFLSLLAFYVISGQPIGDFWDFLRGSLDIAMSYGEAAGNFWWSSQQTVLVLAVIGILGTLSAMTKNASDRTLRFACLIGLALYLFIAFKTGNVRIGHQYTTWNALALSSTIFFMSPALSTSQQRSAGMIGTGWAVACFLLMQYFIVGPSLVARADERADTLIEQANSVIEWLNPKKRLAELQDRRSSAEAKLAMSAPPGLVGTLGSLPWNFSEIIAAGYRFVPQPSLQQYVSYTPRLRARDEQHFAGERRPDYLTFRLATIDGHYRTIEMGPSLPHVLAGYDLDSIESSLPGGALLLRRRAAPRPIELSKLDEKPARLGEWVEVPPLSQGRMLLSIRPKERVVGKLIAFLYKQSSFDLELKFASGAEVKSRIFRNLVSDGFLVLPPDIDDAELFLEAERRPETAVANPLLAVRVSPADLAKVAFSSTYMLSAMSVTIVGAPEHPRSPSDASPEDAMTILRRGLIIESPEVRVLDGRLLAHAPSKISAKFPGGRQLSGEIGFFDGAWQTGNPKPVTFAISVLTSKGVEPLFERTLDPLNRAGDRGAQPFSVELPPTSSPDTRVELLFETRPGTSWGWSYWSNLKMSPPDRN